MAVLPMTPRFATRLAMAMLITELHAMDVQDITMLGRAGKLTGPQPCRRRTSRVLGSPAPPYNIKPSEGHNYDV
ncbi:MAG: hypothetical protein LBT40_00595 [Deltaproteobacteria bacterium]|nr:hypothetical protein [Deltaproteobacteria bacterium]